MSSARSFSMATDSKAHLCCRSLRMFPDLCRCKTLLIAAALFCGLAGPAHAQMEMGIYMDIWFDGTEVKFMTSLAPRSPRVDFWWQRITPTLLGNRTHVSLANLILLMTLQIIKVDSLTTTTWTARLLQIVNRRLRKESGSTAAKSWNTR